MKKILAILAMISSIFSVAKGTTTISGGVGLNLNKDITVPYINLDTNHLVPVYNINEKTSLLVGGGGEFKMLIPQIDSQNQIQIFKFDLLPYFTTQLGYKVTQEIKLRFGANAGIGLGITHVKLLDETPSNKPKLVPIMPLNFVFGVDYKYFSVDLKAGGDIVISKSPEGAFDLGINLGYSF